MDPFEVRLQFLGLLERLSASQQSIQRTVSYAVKYFSACGEDFWECILEDVQKGSINARINTLYFLDGLCERCLLIKSQQRPPSASKAGGGSTATLEKKPDTLYVEFVTRDLSKIIEYVVPEGRQGLPNLVSTKQILENWRSKRIIDPQKVDEALAILDSRTIPTDSQPEAQADNKPNPSTSQQRQDMSKNDVFKRIEEDRERHKRLRERRWVQPISYSTSNLNPHHMPLASFLPLKAGDSVASGMEEELPVDIEFENDWETTSDWNEDDEEVVAEERDFAFPRDGEEPMDLS
ncbi:hypothetical protein FA15DRAFT_667592 [Coprinopsis marcescibilis]|uniref:CID domain-containing protein n=1 Tax=Coprinopsis marcescibilis TaxID=230819 RepID=A0A5C3L0R5_COPMA|nr:hypothetical protein FA15DRAFT_667592 [Coprinopsis marcescibilis]